jgi:DNA polymerase-3 subunit epsilon
VIRSGGIGVPGGSRGTRGPRTSRLRQLLPWASPPWDEVTYWALDLETTGVDPRSAAVLSVGMVPVREGAVRWGERFYQLVRPPDLERLTSSSIEVHHILPDELPGAPEMAAVLPEIERRLAEGALLVHFGRLDAAVLARDYRAAGRRWPRPPVVDTVRLLSRLDHRHRLLDPAARSLPTDLSRARAELGLPAHLAHHALYDALATAELMLVLRDRLEAARFRHLT